MMINKNKIPIEGIITSLCHEIISRLLVIIEISRTIRILYNKTPENSDLLCNLEALCAELKHKSIETLSGKGVLISQIQNVLKNDELILKMNEGENFLNTVVSDFFKDSRLYLKNIQKETKLIKKHCIHYSDQDRRDLFSLITYQVFLLSQLLSKKPRKM